MVLNSMQTKQMLQDIEDQDDALKNINFKAICNDDANFCGKRRSKRCRKFQFKFQHLKQRTISQCVQLLERCGISPSPTTALLFRNQWKGMHWRKPHIWWGLWWGDWWWQGREFGKQNFIFPVRSVHADKTKVPCSWPVLQHLWHWLALWLVLLVESHQEMVLKGLCALCLQTSCIQKGIMILTSRGQAMSNTTTTFRLCFTFTEWLVLRIFNHGKTEFPKNFPFIFVG